MISYAQNLEDVLIARCFEEQTGVYVDIGCHHPVLDSVTCAFYQRGWRGLNIDALDTHHGLFQRLRAGDTNLVNAVGARAGTLPFYKLPGTGLSTLDAAIAERHRADGFLVEAHETPVTPLSTILDKHGVTGIDFLKIDVEGAERDVIAGMDWQRWRPKLVVIEATAPMSPVRNSDEWSGDLIAAGYMCAFFDGLNEYWLAHEASELAKHFSTPVNVFDHLVRAREHVLQRCFDDAGLQRWLKRLLPIFQAGTSPEKEHASHLAALTRLKPTGDPNLLARRLSLIVLGGFNSAAIGMTRQAAEENQASGDIIRQLMSIPEYAQQLLVGHSLIVHKPTKKATHAMVSQPPEHQST